MSVVDVRITMVNGALVASPDVVQLSRSNGDTIKWHNDTTEGIQVNFTAGSPFPADRNPYPIAAGKQANSGNITVGEGTSWSYDITASSGMMADPQVIIER